ncbi:MAG: bacteriohemerythrin [Candidatus Kapabacteria bacterium]|jgi:hemerythrin-like metal-binding protein|nr:bacteriohemerythrin [Candidatus Kapabacteria bacterium]
MKFFKMFALLIFVFSIMSCSNDKPAEKEIPQTMTEEAQPTADNPQEYKPFIEWSDALVLNVEEIDKQHEDLVVLLAHLHEVASHATEQHEIGHLLGELINHTAIHFKTEEDLMIKYKYAGYDEHKKIHDDFVKTCLDVQTKINEEKAKLDMETLLYLKTFLSAHILGQDTKLTAFLNEKGE